MRRFWRCHRRRWVSRAFGRNPLLRWTDRVEACVILVGVLLAVSALPICMAAGVTVYRTHARIYATELQTRHVVAASVAAISSPAQNPRSTTKVILAVWADGIGGARGGEVEAAHAIWTKTQRSVQPGDQIRLWINNNEAPVGAPPPSIQAGLDGIGIAASLWGGVVLALVAVVAILRSPLDQIRQKQMNDEFDRLASGGMPNRSQ